MKIVVSKDSSDYKKNPLIAIDFDGTIARYNGWKGEKIFGEPIPGARDALLKLKRMGYQIMVWTTRGNIDDLAEWLDKYGFPYNYINKAPVNNEHQNPYKPPAQFFIDDRAVRFTGSWKKTLRKIEEYAQEEHARGNGAYEIGI